MKRISEDVVRHVALLSRLEFSADELQRFTHDLDNILGYVDKLGELDTSQVLPTTHPHKLENVFREDEVAASLPVEEALANAPDKDSNYFKVPKVLQDPLT